MIKRVARSVARQILYKLQEKRHIAINHLVSRHYYVIRRKSDGTGFFSNWIWVLTHLCYADKKGYIPVIDQENYLTEYTEDMPIDGSINAWEYYFQQPQENSLHEVLSGRNYILSDFCTHSNELPYTEKNIREFVVDAQKISYVAEIAQRDIRLKESIQLELDQKWARHLEGFNGRVIGVHIRGTDKKAYHQGHYIAPGIDTYIDVVDSLRNKYPNTKIFLCCDEQNTVEIFRKRYGDEVFLNEAYRSEDGDTVGIHLENKKGVRDCHKYLLGKEVMFDCYMLSVCDFLVHTHSNVTNAAIIINGGKYIERILVDGYDGKI